MPLYEYQCEKCGHQFERIQKFSDPPVKKCPKCKGNVKKLPSAPAIQFKGAGWYITDYARKSSSPGKNEKEDKAGENKPAKDDKAAPASSPSKPSGKKKGGED